jgi:hypothetical protein
MNSAYLSVFAALSGSLIGALGGIVTTWITLNGQERARRFAETMSRKQNLYGEYIDEASKLLGDSLTHKLAPEDLPKLVRLYALTSKLRLFAPADVTSMADDVMQRIIETYQNQVEDVQTLAREPRDLDILRQFSEACRRDLNL